MGRPPLTSLERYVRIAKNTAAHKFSTLVNARDFLRKIPWGERTGEIARALSALNDVVDGRHDTPIIEEAFRISENIEASTPVEVEHAAKLIRRIRSDDPRYAAALAARQRFLDASLRQASKASQTSDC